jgi:hypothetical protein
MNKQAFQQFVATVERQARWTVRFIDVDSKAATDAVIADVRELDPVLARLLTESNANRRDVAARILDHIETRRERPEPSICLHCGGPPHRGVCQ